MKYLALLSQDYLNIRLCFLLSFVEARIFTFNYIVIYFYMIWSRALTVLLYRCSNTINCTIRILHIIWNSTLITYYIFTCMFLLYRNVWKWLVVAKNYFKSKRANNKFGSISYQFKTQCESWRPFWQPLKMFLVSCSRVQFC